MEKESEQTCDWGEALICISAVLRFFFFFLLSTSLQGSTRIDVEKENCDLAQCFFLSSSNFSLLFSAISHQRTVHVIDCTL